MLKKKSQLKLNSYKIDTDALQSSLKELSEMKQELQTTISYYKEHEDQLLLENQRLKQEISMCRLQRKTGEKPDHSSCIEKIKRIETELKQQKKQTQKLKFTLEREQKNSKIIAQEYEEKLQEYMMQNKNLVDKYQQRITALNVQLKQSRFLAEMHKIENENYIRNSEMQRMKEQNSVGLKEKDSGSEHYRNYSQNQYIPLVSSKNEIEQQRFVSNSNSFNNSKAYQIPKHSSSKNHHLNLPPKNMYNKDYQTSHEIYDTHKEDVGLNYSYTASYLPNEEDEQVFQASIRKLYQEIKQLGISAKQAMALPQFKKMASNKNPSRRDLFNFMKNPPVEQKNDKNVEKSLNFIENVVRSKYGHLNGRFVTELIIKRVEQYENLSKVNTSSIQISGMTPSGSEQSSASYAKFEYKSEQDKMSKKYYENNRYTNVNRPSIQDHLNIQSQSSIFK